MVEKRTLRPAGRVRLVWTQDAPRRLTGTKEATTGAWASRSRG